MADPVPPAPSFKTNGRKLLLIGWDAADWQVAMPLVEQGKMPALKRLMEQGVWGRHATIRPVLSPMLWTSIATGKRAWKHGIHGFSEPTPDGKSVRPITNLSRKTRTIWNIMTLLNHKSNVVGWWPSHPAEPIDGVMVSNHFQQATASLDKEWPMMPGTVHPWDLAEHLKPMRIHPAELENEHILPFIPRAAEIDQDKDKRMASCAKIVAEVSGVHAAATAIMQLEPWDFMAVYYDGIDHFGHGFMRFHPPKVDWVAQNEFELYKDVIEGAYRYHDMMLDVLMRLAGDDTTIMLISDHGFEPGNLRPKHLPNEPAGPAMEHSPYGIFVLRGPGIRKGEQVHAACLLDVTPTILHLMGLPVGRDMDGKVLVNCFEDEQQVQFIDSWDALPGHDGRHPSGSQLSYNEASEGLKQLEDLGYIDALGEDMNENVRQTARELQFNLADAYADGGRHTDAARLLEALWEQWPEESRFGTRLLSSWIAAGNAVKARETYQLVVERKQMATIDAREKLEAEMKRLKEKAEKDGKEFNMADQPRGVHQQIRRLRARSQTNPQALAFFHGNVLALEGRLAEALEVLKSAESVQTANLPSLYAKQGQICIQMKDWEGARAAFERILAITTASHEAYLGLARVGIQSKAWFEAVANAQASIELQYFNPTGHYYYGLALMRLRKRRMALMALRTAVAQAPGLVEAHEALAKLYRAVHKPDLADQHAERAKALRDAGEKFRKVAPAPALVPELPAMPTLTGRLGPDAGQPLIVVSGLPRSGTSLMMQMLEATGVQIVTDGKRTADESNPKGYYEDDRVKALVRDKDRSWLLAERGKAVKIVAPLLRFIPEDVPCKVIFMERTVRELLSSQRTMLDRSGKHGAVGGDEGLANGFAMQVRSASAVATKRANMEVLPIRHVDAIKDPLAIATRVAEFLGGSLDVQAMAATVDKSLHRAKV